MARCVLALLFLAASLPLAAEIVHRERSLYQNIIVDDVENIRCMKFSLRREAGVNQSCRDMQNPQRLVFTYTRMTLSGLLLLERPPSRILVVGLGGGTIPEILAGFYPEATIDVVEIDPAVIEVARKFFEFDPGERTSLTAQDARVYVKRALARQQTWDLVILDAFNGDYIPEHLLTQEFLDEVRRILSPGGIVLANTFLSSALYDHESTTYAAVYGDIINLKTDYSQNRIIMAGRDGLPSQELIERNANALAFALRPYGIDTREFPPLMKREPDWDVEARVLTDQYSPANLLRSRD